MRDPGFAIFSYLLIFGSSCGSMAWAASIDIGMSYWFLHGCDQVLFVTGGPYGWIDQSAEF